METPAGMRRKKDWMYQLGINKEYIPGQTTIAQLTAPDVTIAHQQKHSQLAFKNRQVIPDRTSDQYLFPMSPQTPLELQLAAD